MARNALDRITAESFADNARIQYLVAATTVRNDKGTPYFRSFDEFIEKSNDKVAIDAMQAYLELLLGETTNDDGNLYENVFLRKYGYLDEKNRLINKDGHLISDDNKLIREDGKYVNIHGNLIDSEGNRVDENGEYVVEFKEFDDHFVVEHSGVLD